MLNIDTVGLATNNNGKRKELEAILSKVLAIRLFTGPKYKSPPEDGRSYFENALLKAEEGARQFGVVTIADDSGLEMVGGPLIALPGMFSSRWGAFRYMDRDGLSDEIGWPDGRKKDDVNNERLLRELRGRTGREREACYRASVVIVDARGNLLHHEEGYMPGRILEKPEPGPWGFGYDPIFESSHFSGRSLAKVPMEEKNQFSHRGRAMRAVVERLAQMMA